MIPLQRLERDNLPLDVESIAERVAEFGFVSRIGRESTFDLAERFG